MIHCDLIRPGDHAVDRELAEGIGLDGGPPPFDYDIRTGEISVIEAVDDYARDLTLAGAQCARWARRRCVLRAQGRRDRDQGDRQAYLKLLVHHQYYLACMPFRA